MLRFTVAGVLVTAVIALIIALLARQAGTERAVESARQVAGSPPGHRRAQLTPEVVGGDPAALAVFNDAMQRYVITARWFG